MRRKLISVLTLFSLNSCAQLHSFPPEPIPNGPVFKAAELPPKGMARIYIFRPRFSVADTNDAPKLLVDKHEVGTLKNGSYFKLTLTPGDHRFSLVPNEGESSVWQGEVTLPLKVDAKAFLAIWNLSQFNKTRGVGVVPFTKAVPFLLIPNDTTRLSSSGIRFEVVDESEALPVLVGMPQASAVQ